MTNRSANYRHRPRMTLVAWGLVIFSLAWFSGRKVGQFSAVMTKVYDVRDLLVDPPDFNNAPAIGVRQSPRRLPATGPSTLIPPSGSPWLTIRYLGATRKDRTNELIQMIQKGVLPQSWEDGPGVISELQGQLIITQLPEAHDEIRLLLQRLREASQIKVAVEGRFVWLSDDAIATLPPAIRDRVAPAQNRDNRIDPSPWTESEINVLLNASQQQNSTSTTFPRILLTSGQRAYVSVLTQRAYVANVVESHLPNGQIKYVPDIDVVSDGTLLDVQAAANADRKSVTLSLRPQLARLIAIEPSSQPTIPIAGKVSIQHPVVDYESLDTTITLDDATTYVVTGFAPGDRKKRLIMLIKAKILTPHIDPEAGIFPRGSERPRIN